MGAVLVCSLRELPPGSIKRFTVQGSVVAIANLNNRLYAFDDMCPHAGGSLSEGFIDNDCVVCPLHGWRFHIETGKNPVFPAEIRTHRVYAEGDKVYVETR